MILTRKYKYVCKCPKGEKHHAGCFVGQRLLLRSEGLCGNVDRWGMAHCALPLKHKGKCHGL